MRISYTGKTDLTRSAISPLRSDELTCNSTRTRGCLSSELEQIQQGKRLTHMAGLEKWRGSVRGLVEAPPDQVWSIVSQTKRLPEWMAMVERCTDLSGQEGLPGYTRLISGFMFPQPDGDRSWIKERLVSMDPVSYAYVYKMEASNVGLDGSTNSLRLIDYGQDSTLVEWLFEVSPVEGSTEEVIVDYLGFLYKSCINRIEAASRKT